VERPLTPLEKMTQTALEPAPTERTYKLFYVDNSDGKVKDMKIKNVNHEY